MGQPHRQSRPTPQPPRRSASRAPQQPRIPKPSRGRFPPVASTAIPIRGRAIPARQLPSVTAMKPALCPVRPIALARQPKGISARLSLLPMARVACTTNLASRPQAAHGARASTVLRLRIPPALLGGTPPAMLPCPATSAPKVNRPRCARTAVCGARMSAIALGVPPPTSAWEPPHA